MNRPLAALSATLFATQFATLGLLALTQPALAAEPVIPGIEVLLSDRIELVQGKRVGLLTNPAAVDRALISTLDRLRSDKRIKLTQLWAPEHGLAAATPNGTSNTKGIEARTGLPIEGLFGDRTAPSAETLARVDVLLFDLQDIGSRTYTYVSTLGKVMQACAAHKVKVVVLDRPNPLGGTLFEGPVRTARRKSLLGWGPFPVTHGMTFGEVAKFYNTELKIKADLEVVHMKGWRRAMLWDDTGLVWVPTSPGIPKPLNATMYVATGMVCGSGPNCNEGGGNAMPFELIGAPWMDGEKFAAALTTVAKGVQGLENVRFRPMTWLPWHGQYDGKITHGVQIHLLSVHGFRPLRLALILLSVLHNEFDSQLKVPNAGRFALIWGNDEVLPQLRAHLPWQQIEASWQKELDAFAVLRARYLLYPP